MLVEDGRDLHPRNKGIVDIDLVEVFDKVPYTSQLAMFEALRGCKYRTYPAMQRLKSPNPA